jgi:hypothetical protein
MVGRPADGWLGTFRPVTTGLLLGITPHALFLIVTNTRTHWSIGLDTQESRDAAVRVSGYETAVVSLQERLGDLLLPSLVVGAALTVVALVASARTGRPGIWQGWAKLQSVTRAIGVALVAATTFTATTAVPGEEWGPDARATLMLRTAEKAAADAEHVLLRNAHRELIRADSPLRRSVAALLAEAEAVQRRDGCLPPTGSGTGELLIDTAWAARELGLAGCGTARTSGWGELRSEERWRVDGWFRQSAREAYGLSEGVGPPTPPEPDRSISEMRITEALQRAEEIRFASAATRTASEGLRTDILVAVAGIAGSGVSELSGRLVHSLLVVLIEDAATKLTRDAIAEAPKAKSMAEWTASILERGGSAAGLGVATAALVASATQRLTRPEALRNAALAATREVRAHRAEQRAAENRRNRSTGRRFR